MHEQDTVDVDFKNTKLKAEDAMILACCRGPFRWWKR